MKLAWIAVIFLTMGVGYCTCRPVCVPLSDEDLARFTPPIEEREDVNFYVKTFQQRDGQWHQCKTWLSRQFFF